jgi:MFS family permease
MADHSGSGAPRRRIFYGWWMAGAGFAVLFYTSGVFFYGFSVFFDTILKHFDWSKGAASGAFALQRMEQGVFGPIVGYITDRWGPRRALLLGAFLMGLGFILLSQINSLWQFYAAFGVLALGLGFGSFLTVNTAVNSWFIRRRGRAMALVSYGPGASSVLVPLIVILIAALDWRDALLLIGIATWFVCFPLAMVMRHKPENYGLHPDGDEPGEAGDAGNAEENDQYPDVQFTARQALRTSTYWKYVVASMCGFIFFSALMIHQFVAFQSFGLSMGETTLLVTLMPLASLPGRILGGVLADSYDKRKVVAMAWAGQLVGALLFVIIDSIYLGFAYAIVFGFFFGIGNPPRVALLGDFFGRKAYGSLLGTQFALTSVGGIFAPVYAGLMFDWFDATGYRIAFLTLAAPAIASIYLYLTMKAPVPPVESSDVASEAVSAG